MELTPKLPESMPLETWLLRYHEICEDCMRRATRASDEKERANLLMLAEAWLALATETETALREMRPTAPSGL
jgi:hypothetical protein